MMEHDIPMMHPAPDEFTATADLGAEMDRLSLTQALHDFDVANARVVDLTQRLIGTGRELAAMREQLASLQREHETYLTPKVHPSLWARPESRSLGCQMAGSPLCTSARMPAADTSASVA